MGTDEIIVSQAHKLRKLLPQLAESQKLRRADLQALKDAIKPAKVSRLVEKKDAYLLLNELLKKHNDAQSSGLEKTNGVIKSLLTKLASEEYAQAVETLRVDEYVQNLQESHQKTYQLYLSRQQEELVKPSSNKKEIRETMNKSYRLFCSHLENLVDYDEDTSYSSLYTLHWLKKSKKTLRKCYNVVKPKLSVKNLFNQKRRWCHHLTKLGVCHDNFIFNYFHPVKNGRDFCIAMTVYDLF